MQNGYIERVSTESSGTNNSIRVGSKGTLAERAFDIRQVVATHLRIYQELIEKS